METISKQAKIECQTRSFIDFLLGDGIHSGWLDELGCNPSLSSRQGPRKREQEAPSVAFLRVNT